MRDSTVPHAAILAHFGFSSCHAAHRIRPTTGMKNAMIAHNTLPSSSGAFLTFNGTCWTPHLGQITASSSMTSPHFLQ